MTEETKVVSMVGWKPKRAAAPRSDQSCMPRPPSGQMSEVVRLCYPTSLAFQTEEGNVVLDPTKKTACLVLDITRPSLGRPALYAYGGGIVLDLGDCTDARTSIRLTPDVALQWAEAFMRYAAIARMQE